MNYIWMGKLGGNNNQQRQGRKQELFSSEQTSDCQSFLV